MKIRITKKIASEIFKMVVGTDKGMEKFQRGIEDVWVIELGIITITLRDTLIVEKNNLFKFCIRCFIKIVKIFVTAGIFLLASVGLMSLIYPDVREELMKVLFAIQKEITTMIQF